MVGAKYPLALKLDILKSVFMLNLLFVYLLRKVKYVLAVLPIHSIPFTLYCH